MKLGLICRSRPCNRGVGTIFNADNEAVIQYLKILALAMSGRRQKNGQQRMCWILFHKGPNIIHYLRFLFEVSELDVCYYLSFWSNLVSVRWHSYGRKRQQLYCRALFFSSIALTTGWWTPATTLCLCSAAVESCYGDSKQHCL